jgi:Na+/proline symporter
VIESSTSLYFWGFLLLYGSLMYLLSPRALTAETFFSASDAQGRPLALWPLTASVFISWIFAKSVTNAANLGAAYGIVGGLAYATYWLSIPLAGFVIYRLRTRYGATGLTAFLASRYGRLAAAAFSLAILIRLYNEIWSNTAVVGSYFGAPGEPAYYGAAVVFTLLTLVYSIKGGLRGSVITDILQAVVFVFFLGIVLTAVVPDHGAATLLTTGELRLDAGIDLLLVAALQIFSYPFHDPVLTDRGFINSERTMLRSFVIAGVLGFVCIVAFSLVGVHAGLNGIGGGDVPVTVGKSLGLAAFFFMTVIMMTSAGSTLDSTFTSLSKSFALDLPVLLNHGQPASIRAGTWIMISFAVLGNLPMLAGTEILKATTISGTMVMGLAPVFFLQRLAGNSPASFHLSFWPGIAVGTVLAAGAWPATLTIGAGKYAALLGANAYGLALCTAGFLAPLLWRRLRPASPSTASA